MRYDNVNRNISLIGERIRKERKTAGFTQSQFAQEIDLDYDSRQSISAWENGCRLPPLKYLLNMCEVFHCEIEYLLCESDFKTKKETDINNAIGLSADAIFRLSVYKTKAEGQTLRFNSPINAFIEHEAFIDLVEAIKKHIWSFNNNHYGIDRTNKTVQNALANTFNCEPEELKGYIEMSSQSLIEKTLMKIVNDLK